MLDAQDLTLVAIVLVVAELGGIGLAIDAVFQSRSSQAATAWIVGLVAFPLLSIPLYLVFGRARFHGYVERIQKKEETLAPEMRRWNERMEAHAAPLDGEAAEIGKAIAGLTGDPVQRGNEVTLLEDGKATYEAMLEAVLRAEIGIFVQFYIVRDDTVGRQLRDALVGRAKAGVPVFFLYDEIGSVGLSSTYLESLHQAGVQVSGFKTTRGRGNRFQVNFRNHRKLLLVDGHTGFIGGLNLGDEYLDYRDTHLRIRGPAVRSIQRSFSSDWYWATDDVPGLDREFETGEPGHEALAVVCTGPGDPEPRCSLLFLSLINMAKRRLWIASPYFVPDEVCVRALQAAALRGVDVRILLPDVADNALVEYASFTYYPEMLDAGVELFRYRGRFMHQKVILVDETLAGVGTVNLDNRSLYLNFEATALGLDTRFVRAVQAMLERDLAQSQKVDRSQYCDRSFGFRLLARIARLAAPIL